MDKDKIGLIKYVSILVVEALLPLIWLLSILCIYLPSNDIYSNLIALVGIILIFVLPILYFLLPIIVTILAIRNHWSIYLDKFFNQLKLPTIILSIVIAIIIIYEKKHIMINFTYSRFWVWFYYSIIPPYCLIYIVILIHNIFRKYSSHRKNKFKGMS